MARNFLGAALSIAVAAVRPFSRRRRNVDVTATLASETDWTQIVALYDVLLGAESSPVVELNRAVAIAMRDGIETGLSLAAQEPEQRFLRRRIRACQTE